MRMHCHKEESKDFGIEGRYNWRGVWLYVFCRRYSIWIRDICLMYNYCVHNNLMNIFIQMEYPRGVPVCKARIIVWKGGARQFYLPSIPYSLPYPYSLDKTLFDGKQMENLLKKIFRNNLPPFPPYIFFATHT